MVGAAYAQFLASFSAIKVDHLITDNLRDLRRPDLELLIRFGNGVWAEETAEFLFDDMDYPVCSPAFAASHPGVTTADLPRLPLMEVDWVAPDWVCWEDILSHAGLRPEATKDRRLSKFSVAIAAAMADQGVVIGWHRIVAPMIAAGQLVRLTDLSMRPTGGYHLTWNTGLVPSPAAW